MQIDAFIKNLFEKAGAEGLQQSEVYYAAADSFEANILDGAVIGYNVSSSQGLSFRALLNGKMGYASTQVFDEDALAMLVEGAKANAEMIESEDEQFIFEGSERYEVLNAYNPSLDALEAAWKLDLGKALEKAAVSVDPRISGVEEACVFSSGGECRIVNTKGLDVSFRENGIGMYVIPIAKDDERVNTAMRFMVRRSNTELDLEKVAREAALEAVDGLYAAPVPSGKYRVVLRHDAAASLLSTFAEVFSADAAQKGLSLLKGREGEEIAAACVSLLDDPFHALGMSGRPFDGEGVATYKKALIESGRLETLLHNLKTARKQGVNTTANASKASYAAPVEVAPSNLYFAPGEKPLDALLKEAGDGLLITALEGMHAGANTISGDFSLSAKGYKIENGALGGAVNQITVAGNFFELLRDVLALGSDLAFGFPGASSYGSPSILVRELSVAGT